ncbi:MAG: putative LPS assembly protein LptD [Bacteroidota bacterium]
MRAAACLPASDSISNDSTAQKVSKNVLDSRVDYDALDSIRMDVFNQVVYLFNQAEVSYEDVNLKAGYIVLDMENSIVLAAGRRDSAGRIVQKPELKQGEQMTEADTIIYNFKTKRGLMKYIQTVQGEGYITASVAKKDSNDIYYIKNGKYTTCDADHPHFHIEMTKMKVIPDDKIVTGPAYLVIADVPTPLAVPFGYFPNKKGRSSGILIPAYGESPSLGYFLKDGGYYFGKNDFIDLAVRGDIYSRGSWAVKTNSNYNKRYRFSGDLSLGYSKFKESEKEFPDYSEKSDFFVRWTHNQDPRSNPTVRFSANVNALSSNYNKFNSYSANDYLSNTFQSNIAWSKSWKYFNLSANLRHSQNTLSHKVDLSLPQVALSMNRIYPTKLWKKEGVIKERQIDKLGLSYLMDFENRVSVLDSNLFSESIKDSLNYGIRHSIPVSWSIIPKKLPLTFTSALNLSSAWYFSSIRKHYDADAGQVVTDTVKGFSMANQYSASLTLTTKLYGFYSFKKAKVKAIRHVMTPSIAFSYRPDFGDKEHGYESYTIPSSSVPQVYSIYQNGIYGFPPTGESQSLGFNINNNLEMKLRPSEQDTSGKDRKVTLIESFGLSSSYNFAAPSFNLAVFNLFLRTKLFQKLDISLNGTLDPYKINDLGNRYDRFMWEDGKIGRLTSATASFSTNLRSTKADQKKESDRASEEELRYINEHPDYYVDFNVPWNLYVSYNLRYSRPGFASEVTQSLTFSGDLSVTKKWKLGFNSGWDFVANDFTYTSVNIYRDLHCWEMSFNWVPFGFRKSYTLNINVKSSVLQDLKLSRKRDWYDYN